MSIYPPESRASLRDRILRPRAGTPRPHPPAPSAPSAPARGPDLASVDRSIIAILDAPASTTSIERAFAEKESQLRALFATISAESRTVLRERFIEPHPSDPLAERFNRLATERRARVLRGLDDQGVKP